MGLTLSILLISLLSCIGLTLVIYEVYKLSSYIPVPSHVLFPDQIPYEMNWLNVRSAITKEEWECISAQVSDTAEHKCSICGQSGKEQGYPRTTECHEIWEINDSLKIQKLIGFQALCPRCHMVKHLGFTRRRGQSKESFKHMCIINKISVKTGLRLLHYYRNIVKHRKFVYRLDLSYLNKYPELTSYDFNGLDAIKCHKPSEDSTQYNRRERDSDRRA